MQAAALKAAGPGPYISLCLSEQDVAERVAREAQRRRFAPRVMAMDAYSVAVLPSERLVVLVASTTGQAWSHTYPPA